MHSPTSRDLLPPNRSKDERRQVTFDGLSRGRMRRELLGRDDHDDRENSHSVIGLLSQLRLAL